MRANRWLVAGLVLCLVSAGCLQAAPNPTPSLQNDTDASGSQPAPASPSPSSPPSSSDSHGDPSDSSSSNLSQTGNGTENNADPSPKATFDPVVHVNASYARIMVDKAFTVQRVVVQDPADRSMVLEPNKTGSVLVGHLDPSTPYTVAMKAVGPGDMNQTRMFKASFTTNPPDRSWPSVGNASTIQPGNRAEFGDSGCTLNAVVRGPLNETLYMLTAGHCTAPGETASVDGEEFGVVVDNGANATGGEYAYDAGDWALIRVYDEARDRIHPAVRYWGGPVGVTGKVDVDFGDAVCWFGHGVYVSEVSPHRCGNLTNFQDPDATDNETFRFRGVVTDGDSGAPVIHYKTGTLVGIISAQGGGSTLCDSLFEIREDAGVDVSLATGAWDPPAKDWFPPYEEPIPVWGDDIKPGGPCEAETWRG